MTGCLAIPAAALAQDFKTAPQKWHYVEGQLLTLVAPEYPEQSVRNGETGTVEVTGRIKPDGSFESFVLWSEPLSDFLEEAVRKVVPHWRLQPRLESPSCQFREAQGRVTIWFDLVDLKPKVSYSVIRPDRLATIGFAPILTERTATQAPRPIPPAGLERAPDAPREILQVAYVGILADGTVHSVTVAPRRYWRAYEASLRNALMQWRFERGERASCTEVEVRFPLD